MSKEKKNYAKRSAESFNKFRSFFQILVCKYFYMIRFKLVYRLKVEGLENVPKDNEYIVCPNHLSTLDPPLVCGVLPRRIAFMAKQELFDIRFLRWWIDWLGAIAVNRESLGPSTIKTVMNIKKSEWVFGIFPQGTRGLPGTISGVTKGFAGLAKITKCAILPVGITGTEEVKRLPFSGKIVVKVGKPIPYSDDVEGMVSQWIDSIQKLTGYKYVQPEIKD
ncbi:1-acyl-sn-glycerol-3-phosphate acyltransferase [Candidatus Gastranaerophilales bacterium]|nr:MAG: 1-acyl-sn-glycerol-3-phosphate acyltransferase [Candidatus Gastranaerophilales bacterium]PWL80381.1 MAG: 1-acyl-sn-glycerol-3-phosphate acyltransferase [Candidatus Gastranaerophilales bacterium]